MGVELPVIIWTDRLYALPSIVIGRNEFMFILVEKFYLRFRPAPWYVPCSGSS